MTLALRAQSTILPMHISPSAGSARIHSIGSGLLAQLVPGTKCQIAAADLARPAQAGLSVRPMHAMSAKPRPKSP
jgi:hypothetical protein